MGNYIPPANIDWTGKAAHSFWDGYAKWLMDPAAMEHDIAYARLRQDGFTHEQAVRGAQAIRSRPVSQNPEPENGWNRDMARMPLSMPIPEPAVSDEAVKAIAAAAIQEAAEQAPQPSKKKRFPGNAEQRQRFVAAQQGVTQAQELLALRGVLEAMAAGNYAQPEPTRLPVVITPGPGAGAAGPSVEEVIKEVASTPPPSGMSGRRMAMRYGLPALGALLGLYGLGAVANANARDEREVVRA
jgi:hypothetical protein